MQLSSARRQLIAWRGLASVFRRVKPSLRSRSRVSRRLPDWISQGVVCSAAAFDGELDCVEADDLIRYDLAEDDDVDHVGADEPARCDLAAVVDGEGSRPDNHSKRRDSHRRRQLS